MRPLPRTARHGLVRVNWLTPSAPFRWLAGVGRDWKRRRPVRLMPGAPAASCGALPLVLALIPATVLASPFERPVPEGATGTAALSIAAASVAFVLALGAGQWLILRR